MSVKDLDNNLDLEFQQENVIDSNDNSPQKILEVNDLSVLFKAQGTYFRAVNDISFSVNKGDFFGVVGESGSGKSTTGKAIVRLVLPSGGKILFENKLISVKKLKNENRKFLQENAQMIFQDPTASLNYSKNILNLVAEPLVVNKTIKNKAKELSEKLKTISSFYHHDFLRRYKSIRHDFYKDFYNGLEQAYDKVLNLEIPTNDLTPKEFLEYRNNEFVNEIWNVTEIIENFIKKRDDLADEYYEKSKVYDSKSDYRNLLKAKNELEVINKVVDYQTNKVVVNKKNLKLTKKDRKLFFKNKKQELCLDGKELAKNLLIAIKNKIKVSKQNSLLSNDFITHIHFNITLLENKLNYLFLDFLREQFKNLTVVFVENSADQFATIANQICMSIANEFINLSSNFAKSTVDEKKQIISSLKELDLKTKKILDFFKSNLNKLNESNLNEINNLAKENHVDEKKITELFNIFGEAKNLSDTNLEIINQASLDVKNSEVDKDYALEEIENDLKEIDSFVGHDENGSKFYDFVTENFENLDKLNEFKTLCKQQFINSKERYSYFRNALKKISDNFIKSKKFKPADVVNLKKELFKLDRTYKAQLKKDIEAYIQNYHQNLSSIKKVFLKDKLLRKSYKYIEDKLVSFNAYKNFILRESLYYEKAVELPNNLKWIFHGFFRTVQKRNYVYDALEKVGLKKEHAYRYPHEFSGGQKQRIVIARALITNPKLVLADEPISALDVSIQSQIINLMKELAQKHQITFIFIAHDLSMVNHVCNKLIIMHRGKILEGGEVDKVFKNPVHPYTKSLMKAVPKLSRIHVDLASFEEKHTYDSDYSLVNVPKYHNVDESGSHYVLATNNQYDEWKGSN
ncbi:ATP-binding cassette domain-containing protein [Malacoplasma penetrans]|uniref:Oligopeptide transport ATP-binding protein OppF n=1 Tax=Malacoplasma penetrans (strain HF-2) TaxID=272633 RepID=Q8EVL1_MALP2|nr:ATP-binding cassette domain-containing protein [Malacoplasma penetrans]RXY96394.1 ATP-binding cassette domain-containing protein [Malacoplasma penetrans]BAC44342.1 oligopeptide transport ATP-binding protein OppF [Malacoplasma penetrans HF-2]